MEQPPEGPMFIPQSLSCTPWAINPDALPLQAVAPPPPPAAGQGEPLALLEDDVSRRGVVAVLRADGYVMPRCSTWMERIGWAVSCEGLAARVEAAADAGAAAIMICFDSPGGAAAGVQEAAARIAAVAKEVTVVAVADHLMASGAYWLAAGCTSIVASPSAQVGSIGVISVRVSYARALEADGYDVDVIYRGEGKTDFYAAVEFTDAGRERLQESVDAVYGQFVAAVAAGRGVTPTTVARQWGARVMPAALARQEGMVNSVADARTVHARLSTAGGRRAYRQHATLGAMARTLNPT